MTTMGPNPSCATPLVPRTTTGSLTYNRGLLVDPSDFEHFLRISSRWLCVALFPKEYKADINTKNECYKQTLSDHYVKCATSGIEVGEKKARKGGGHNLIQSMKMAD